MSAPQQTTAHTPLATTVADHVRACLAAGADEAGLYDRILQEVERPLLELTLRRCGGNQMKAAALLGINRNTLRKKLRVHGIAMRRARGKGA